MRKQGDVDVRDYRQIPLEIDPPRHHHYRRPQDVAEWISWGPDVWTAAGPTRNGDVLHGYLDRVYQEALETPGDDIWSEIARNI